MKKFVKWLLRPVWSRIAARIDIRMAPLKSEINSVSQRLSHLSQRVCSVELQSNHVPVLERRLAALEAGWRQHVPALLNAASSVGALGHELASLREAVERTKAKMDVDHEIHALQNGGSRNHRKCTPTGKACILAREKLDAARTTGLKVNLGCGQFPLKGYINVDQRELPGLDIIGDLGELPFEQGSVQEFFSSHTLDHFSQERLRRLLSYWKTLLAPNGVFRAVVADGEAMLSGIANGSYSFEQFREALFGASFEGDSHANLLTPGSLTNLLSEAGFKAIEVPVKARRNGLCFEFEIRAAQGPPQQPEPSND